MSGSGELADQIRSMFGLFRQKYGLNQKVRPLDCSLFEPPIPKSGQLRLF